MITFLPKFIYKALFFLTVLLVFLIFVFFFPSAGDTLEFNKQALLAAGLASAFLLSALKTFLNRELRFVRTQLDLPIFLFLMVSFASAALSSSLATSFFGKYGVFHGGLLSFLLYIGLFYLVVNAGQRALAGCRLSLIGSSLVLAIFAVFQYFEIYVLPWKFTHQRFWTPVGGVRDLAAYLLIITPLVIGKAIKTKGLKKTFSLLVVTLNLAAVCLISGWGGAARNVLPETYRTLPTEVSLDWQTSWQIANSVLGVKPLLGSGLGMFSSVFTRFKPLGFNYTPFWNIRFNRPANEWFETLTTLGLAGIGLWVYFWARIVRLSVDRKTKSPTTLSLFTFLAVSFFVPLVTATAFLLWTLLALWVAETGLTEKVFVKAEAEVTDFRGKKKTQKIPLFKIVSGCLLFSVFCFSYFYFGCYYRADIRYQQAISEFGQDREKAFDLVRSAARLNPLNDVYQTGLAAASLGIASPLSQQASPSAQLIRQFVDLAIISGNRAIQLNPENVRNWENLAGLYQNLIALDPAVGEQVFNSLNQAINLDPANPALRSSLANFSLKAGRTEDAINQFYAAIQLKSDYVQAHYDLAQAYKAADDLAGAKQELETVLTLVPQDGDQFQTVQEELQNLALEEDVASDEKLKKP